MRRAMTRLTAVVLSLLVADAQSIGAAAIAWPGAPAAAWRGFPPPAAMGPHPSAFQAAPPATAKSAPEMPTRISRFLDDSKSVWHELRSMAWDWLSDDTFLALQAQAVWLLAQAPRTAALASAPRLPMPRRAPRALELRPSPLPLPPAEVLSASPAFQERRELNMIMPDAQASPNRVRHHALPRMVPALAPPSLPAPSRPVNDIRRLVRYPSLRRMPSLVNFPIPRLGSSRPSGITTGILPRMDGRWFQSKHLRLRVNYLNPVAFSRANSLGVEYKEAGRRALNPSEVLPPSYWGTYVIYHAGQTVQYEIELENPGTKPLELLTVVSSQEALNRRGGPGRLLPQGSRSFAVELLKPGEKTKIRASFKITGSWTLDGSFEQTHVRVTGLLPGTRTGSELIDAPQAGIVDPPPI